MARTLITPKGRAGRIQGIPELAAKLSTIIDRTLGKEIKKVYMEGALQIRDAARGLAPVKTGRLKSAIFAAYGESTKQNVLVGVNYKIAGYAWIVEFGSKFARPQPYMRPALTRTRSKAVATIAEGLRRLLTENL